MKVIFPLVFIVLKSVHVDIHIYAAEEQMKVHMEGVFKGIFSAHIPQMNPPELTDGLVGPNDITNLR